MSERGLADEGHLNRSYANKHDYDRPRSEAAAVEDSLARPTWSDGTLDGEALLPEASLHGRCVSKRAGSRQADIGFIPSPALRPRPHHPSKPSLCSEESSAPHCHATQRSSRTLKATMWYVLNKYSICNPRRPALSLVICTLFDS